MNNVPASRQEDELSPASGMSRRNFFRLAGGIAGAGMVLSACHPRTGTSDVYLGADDTALLNLLYIMQQLEAAFYTQAFATPYYGMNPTEYDLLKDVRDQEVAHREFLKKLIGKDAVADISPDFSLVTFADRTSVITYSVIIEDMVISAFNGTARLFQNTGLLLTFSKMASVEARHSAYFRNLLDYGTFALSNATVGNATDADALDKISSPHAVLTQAQTFLHTRYDASKLPN